MLDFIKNLKHHPPRPKPKGKTPWAGFYPGALKRHSDGIIQGYKHELFHDVAKMRYHKQHLSKFPK